MLADLAVSAFLSPSTLALTIPSASSLRNHFSTYDISTIYSCAPYTPSDFPASSYYDTRFLLERRRPIKCPSLPLQLIGGKIVQEALSRPGCSKASKGTRVRDGLGPHRSYCTQRTSVTPGGGMWALDSEDAGLVATIDHLGLAHRLREKMANHPGPIARSEAPAQERRK
jgi:glutathione synthase